MADDQIKLGKSAEQVALEMTHYILQNIEGKSPKDMKRVDYLDTYVECLLATRFDRHTVKEWKKS